MRIIAALLLMTAQANALCVSHDPADPRCSMNDILRPVYGSVQFYLDAPLARQNTLYQCYHHVYPSLRPPLYACQAAAAANSMALARGYH